ncbi:hypothetical protein LTSEGIV_1457, partial [Salmonella enterica subsp. enterica serovar Give str. S5-487]
LFTIAATSHHPVIATYPEGLYLKGFACRVM